MENGVLESLQLCYETYGTLNNNGTNAILVCHALLVIIMWQEYIKKTIERVGGIMRLVQVKR